MFIRKKPNICYFFRIKVVKKDSASVQLKVERVKGRNYDVDVSYQTDQMNNKRTLYDIDIFPAYESEDFSQANGVLTFVKNRQVKCLNEIEYE